MADRSTYRILGCYVVGERAVEIAQLAAIAIAAGMRADEHARVAISFPTYAEVRVHAGVRAAAELRLPLGGLAAPVVTEGQNSVNAVARLIAHALNRLH